jgi:hypothetical protein
MAFVSFVGRVLFASLFLLSAYQEYVRPSLLTPQILPRISTHPLIICESSPPLAPPAYHPSAALFPIWWLVFRWVESECFAE